MKKRMIAYIEFTQCDEELFKWLKQRKNITQTIIFALKKTYFAHNINTPLIEISGDLYELAKQSKGFANQLNKLANDLNKARD